MIAYGIELLEGQTLDITIEIHFALKASSLKPATHTTGAAKPRAPSASASFSHFTNTHRRQTWARKSPSLIPNVLLKPYWLLEKAVWPFAFSPFTIPTGPNSQIHRNGPQHPHPDPQSSSLSALPTTGPHCQSQHLPAKRGGLAVRLFLWPRP